MKVVDEVLLIEEASSRFEEIRWRLSDSDAEQLERIRSGKDLPQALEALVWIEFGDGCDVTSYSAVITPFSDDAGTGQVNEQHHVALPLPPQVRGETECKQKLQAREVGKTEFAETLWRLVHEMANLVDLCYYDEIFPLLDNEFAVLDDAVELLIRLGHEVPRSYYSITGRLEGL